MRDGLGVDPSTISNPPLILKFSLSPVYNLKYDGGLLVTPWEWTIGFTRPMRLAGLTRSPDRSIWAGCLLTHGFRTRTGSAHTRSALSPRKGIGGWQRPN